MPKVVKDSLFFHQPRDEGEVRLAILDAVFTWSVFGFQSSDVKIKKAEFGKNALDDLWNRQVLENAAIGAVLQEPKPRDHRCLVQRSEIILPRIAESIDMSMEFACRSMLMGNMDRDFVPHDLLRSDRIIGRKQLAQ